MKRFEKYNCKRREVYQNDNKSMYQNFLAKAIYLQNWIVSEQKKWVVQKTDKDQ